MSSALILAPLGTKLLQLPAQLLKGVPVLSSRRGTAQKAVSIANACEYTATHVIKKTLFERLYLISGTRTFAPWVNSPYSPTNLTVHSTIISRFLWFFLVITIHQVIWPSPNSLVVAMRFFGKDWPLLRTSSEKGRGQARMPKQSWKSAPQTSFVNRSILFEICVMLPFTHSGWIWTPRKRNQ